MNIALFGGTFDPIHSGHLRAAEAAANRFRLHRILFIPCGTPPHKVRDRLTSFAHRYAMVALACAQDERFVPSLLEAPRADGRPHYSVETVRRAKRLLSSKDRLFFLVGIDAFLDLPQWHQYRRLLNSADFIVVSRPGHPHDAIWRPLPPDLIGPAPPAARSNRIRLLRSNVLILDGVDVPVAARDIREAIRAGRRVTGLVPPLVEEYILKEGLYRPDRRGQTR